MSVERDVSNAGWGECTEGLPGLYRVAPETPLRVIVLDRGWEVVAVWIGTMGAELRWPDTLVPPFRGTALRLRVTLGGVQGIVNARVVGLGDDGAPGMRVSVVWEDVSRPARSSDDRRVHPRWVVPSEAPYVEVYDPVTRVAGPRMRLIDVGRSGLGLEADAPTPGLIPGLPLPARLTLCARKSYPVKLCVTRSRLVTGSGADVLRLGARLVEAPEACASALASCLFREADGCTPRALGAAGFPLDGLASEVQFGTTRLPEGTLLVSMAHRGGYVGGALIQPGTGEACLEVVWIDEGYRCESLSIAFWQALSVALLARGLNVLTGDDRGGAFPFVTQGKPEFRVDLAELVTGAGQSPREWRRWHAPAYATAVATGQFRPGVLGVARATLYGAVAR